MRVPVIVVLPAQEPLRESAAAASEGRREPLDSERVSRPPQVELDPTFPAVPLSTGDASDASLESMTADASQAFAVRGSIDTADVDAAVPSPGMQVYADPEIDIALTCGSSPPVGDAALVATKLDVATLAVKGLDGTDVAVAIMDTGINLGYLSAKLGRTPRFDAGNSWTPVGVGTAPGAQPVGHGTMCAYDTLIAAPNATLLDYPMLLGTAPGGGVMGRRLSIALLGYAQLLVFWAVAFAPGSVSRYKALVVNNSWTMFHPSWDFPTGHPGRYADNPNHPFNVIVSTLARTGADILFCAGNCGSSCADGRCQNSVTDTIRGANALPDVLTLADCDTTDARVGYSSQGPAIPGMAAQKPDLTAYTHFLGSEAFGPGTPDSGTSTACPVAAGCVAALRTKVDRAITPPPSLFAQLKATAKPLPGIVGFSNDVGHGLLDPVAAGTSLGVI